MTTPNEIVTRLLEDELTPDEFLSSYGPRRMLGGYIFVDKLRAIELEMSVPQKGHVYVFIHDRTNSEGKRYIGKIARMHKAWALAKVVDRNGFCKNAWNHQLYDTQEKAAEALEKLYLKMRE